MSDDINLDLVLNSDSDSEHDKLTASTIYNSIKNLWLNEKLAPEILPHKSEYVECLYLQIEEMEKNIQRLPLTDIRRSCHELEVRRIKYILSSYLRIRIEKIENYAEHISQQEEARKRNNEEQYLSDNETQFMLSYKESTDKYFNDTLKFVSDVMPNEIKKHPIKPNLNAFVFFHSKKNVNGIIVDNDNQEDDVDIKEGSKMIMPYNSIKHLLKNEDIQLI